MIKVCDDVRVLHSRIIFLKRLSESLLRLFIKIKGNQIISVKENELSGTEFRLQVFCSIHLYIQKLERGGRQYENVCWRALGMLCLVLNSLST